MCIIKQILYFPGFILCHVPEACCLMIARCTVESTMIRGYHQYISKLLFESELDLLKCCNIDILMQNKLKHISRCCTHLMLHNRKIGKKELANCCDLPNSPKFFPLQSFLLHGNRICKLPVSSTCLGQMTKLLPVAFEWSRKWNFWKVADMVTDTLSILILVSLSTRYPLNFAGAHQSKKIIVWYWEMDNFYKLLKIKKTITHAFNNTEILPKYSSKVF